MKSISYKTWLIPLTYNFVMTQNFGQYKFNNLYNNLIHLIIVFYDFNLNWKIILLKANKYLIGELYLLKANKYFLFIIFGYIL